MIRLPNRDGRGRRSDEKQRRPGSSTWKSARGDLTHVYSTEDVGIIELQGLRCKILRTMGPNHVSCEFENHRTAIVRISSLKNLPGAEA